MSRVLLVSSNLATGPFPVYPLGLAVIASALEEAGHAVEQFDLLAAGGNGDALVDRILGFEPAYVCVSVRNLDDCDSLTATTYPAAARGVVARVRQACPATIIIGGPAFSILPEEILAYTGADYGIVGEGERVVCALIRDLEQGRTPPRIQRDPQPIPAGDLVSPRYTQELVDFYLEQSGMVNLQSKRGCSHGCIYCSYPSLEGREYRFRDPRAVVDDMERVRAEHGADRFFFADSVFNDPQGHYLMIAEELVRRGRPQRWCCYIRPEGIGRPEIALLKRAGLYAAELGTDAASDTTLRTLGKGFTFAQALEVNRAFVAERVPCAHFVMFGGPGETRETVAEGLANLDRLEHTVVFAFQGIRILPGTPLHALGIREGFLDRDTPLREPLFYQSPLVDRELLFAMVFQSFRGRRDRIFPPDASNKKRDVMRRFGFRGLLWDTLIRFPEVPPC